MGCEGLDSIAAAVCFVRGPPAYEVHSGGLPEVGLPPGDFTVRYWIILFIAAVLEIAWAIGLKYTAGFTRLWPSVATVSIMAASMFLLAQAARGLPIGTAYAVWTGVGAAGTAIFGMWLLGEPATVGRIVSLLLIISGVAGLKYFSA